MWRPAIHATRSGTAALARSSPPNPPTPLFCTQSTRTPSPLPSPCRPRPSSQRGRCRSSMTSTLHADTGPGAVTRTVSQVDVDESQDEQISNVDHRLGSRCLHLPRARHGLCGAQDHRHTRGSRPSRRHPLPSTRLQLTSPPEPTPSLAHSPPGPPPAFQHLPQATWTLDSTANHVASLRKAALPCYSRWSAQGRNLT